MSGRVDGDFEMQPPHHEGIKGEGKPKQVDQYTGIQRQVPKEKDRRDDSTPSRISTSSAMFDAQLTKRGYRLWDLVVVLAALLGSVLNTVALSTNGWITEGGNSTGLWTSCRCIPYTPPNARGWQVCSQVFLGIGLLIGLGMIVAIALYVASELPARKKKIIKMLILSAQLLVFLMAMGCLPMGLLFDLDRKLSFGFGLCVISILLGLGPTGLHMLKRAGSEENNWVAGVIVGLLLSSIHFLAVSYALHMWATDEGTRTTVGLWVSCVCGDDLIQHESWYLAMRGLVATSDLILVVNVFLVATLAGLKMTHRRRPLLVTAILILCFIAGLILLVAIVMFSTRQQGSKGFSFGLCVTAGICCITNICIGVIQRTAIGGGNRQNSSI